MDPGDWIGEAIELDGEASPAPRPTDFAELGRRPHRRLFRRAAAADSAGFLELYNASFAEYDAAGRELGRCQRELVAPRTRSLDTVVVAVLCRAGGQVLLAVDDDDLPAAQCFDGNSEILVAPAWRLPLEVRGIEAGRAWVRARLEGEYGLRCRQTFELGGRYHPSAGLTPEVVQPLALEVAGAGGGPRPLTWLPLADVVAGREELRDGHLRIVSWRAAHALGLLRAGGGRGSGTG
jgi:hypothetical protein